jgi:hypothetical protein
VERGGNGLAYYLEAIFLLRTASHSSERRPHATSEEFAYFDFGRKESDPLRTSWLEYLATPA